MPNALFSNAAAEFVYIRTYSRYLDDLGRRETWPETVDRFMTFLEDQRDYLIPDKTYDKIRHYLITFQVMPSMRLLWSAGEAVRRQNMCAYNCTGTAIQAVDDFAQILYILTCGAGVGFSVQKQYIQKLPIILQQTSEGKGVYQIDDSKQGWADSIKILMNALYQGRDVEFDYSLIRPKGSPLKTFGGRCLSGDTIVYKDRKKSRGYNEITIKQLYEMKVNGKVKRFQSSSQPGPSHFNKIRLRSLDQDQGHFFRNRLIDVVYNGRKPVYEILTQNGYRIKATQNHRFMKQDGQYYSLSEFDCGDVIAVNGSKWKKTGTCVDCGISISRRAVRCKMCFDKTQLNNNALYTTARQRKDCRAASKNYCQNCGTTDKDVRFEIHHIDQDVYNNNDDNLLNLCPKCHRRQHAKRQTFGDAYSHKYMSYDKIISINYVGVQDTYDLQMDGPNHNFVANGFISHNSSGPEPLKNLHKFIYQTFAAAEGRKLTPLQCHDIVCQTSQIVLCGGVRRSALISLSDLSDNDMRYAKDMPFPPRRFMSNNSAVYNKKPNAIDFLVEWAALAKSGTGERGIFNLTVGRQRAPKRRNSSLIMITNPCAQVLLRLRGTCNLSQVVIKSDDTIYTLFDKVQTAAWLGVIQSTFTNFPYLRDIWRINAEQERLLGISLTGQMDAPHLLTPANLKLLKEKALYAAQHAAKVMGINMPVSITVVKPAGTTSQLTNSSPGMHTRYSQFYIRRYRIAAVDPLFSLLRDSGIKYAPQNGEGPNSWDQQKEGRPWTESDVVTWVVEFPVKSPLYCITRKDLTAIAQLEHYKTLQQNWCQMNTSCTIYVKDNEWMQVGQWVYDNWQYVTAVSFLPYDGGKYQQAPYEQITEQKYEKMILDFPKIDYSLLSQYEKDDRTTGAKQYACVSGSCDL